MKIVTNGVGLVCDAETEIPILCDVCNEPFDLLDWDDRHESSDDSGAVYHPHCCPECAESKER